MERTTVATNLKPLERDGWVTVRPAAGDPRARVVEITELGLSKVEGALRLWQAAQGEFEDAFGSERAALLRDALRSVLDIDLDPWAE